MFGTVPIRTRILAALVAVSALFLVEIAFTLQLVFVIGVENFRSNMVVVPTVLGTVIGFLLAIVVILRRQLSYQNEQLGAVVQVAQEFLYLRDSDGNYIFVSGGCERVSGYTAQEFYDTPDLMTRLVHPDDIDRWSGHAHRMDEGGAPEILDFRIIRKDKTVAWISHVCNSFISPETGAVMVRSSNVDITDRMDYAHKLENATDRLEHEVRKAEFANRAKTEFLNYMSHELRTPLNAIIGFSEMMENEVCGPIGNDNYGEYATGIRQSGRLLLGILNDILDMSSIEAGQIQLWEETFNVEHVVRACLSIMNSQAQVNGVAIRLDLPNDDLLLFADEKRFQQIIGNLVSNAIKFTPSGGSVTISARRSADCRLDVCVADTGIGISQDHQQHVLEPFSRVEDSMVRRYEGTGLGLPIVRSLVEAHGGTLYLDSSEGEGTSVTVSFPAERVRLAVACRPGSV